MAKQFLNGIDAVGIPLIHLRLENLAASPGSPYGPGHFYYNTALGSNLTYDGSVWRNPRARGDHTGTQLSATISDLATTVQGYSLDLFAAPAGNLALGSKRITGVADPVASQDAATQNYVLSQVQSAAAGISSKDPVRAVATANIASMTGTATVDGVALIAGDRVLLTAQTTGSQNGPWIVSAGAWTRPTTEGSTQWELDRGALWLVLEGTVYAGTQFRLTNTGAVVPGTTAITISQFSAASPLVAGSGLLNTSGTWSIKLPGSSGLVVDGTGIYLDTTIATRKYSGTIGDGTSTTLNVNHAIGTRDVQVQVYQAASPYASVEVDVQRTDTNNVAILFAAAPATGAYRVVVMG